MKDAHSRAKSDLGLILAATLILDPLGSGLTESELRGIAIDLGVAVPLLDEVMQEFWSNHQKKPSDKTITASSTDLMLISAAGNGHVYPPPFPMTAVKNIHEAFNDLEYRLGVHTAKTVEQVCAALQSYDSDEIKRALGFLVTFKHFGRVGDGFIRKLNHGGQMGDVDRNHPQAARLEECMARVKAVLASRGETAEPAAPPLETFQFFLRKQGWIGLAEWWSQASSEVKGLWEYYPTAACVLAGALLEGALVAIAEPSKQARMWRHKFLDDDPRKWQLGDLIKQAEASGTFTANEASHARTLAELRNRIHAGRFGVSGPEPFRPPRTNIHEAQISKLHLELLLDRLLLWKPVADLL